MKNILAKGERRKLEGFVTKQTLLAFDFDGTLAPIVKDPRAAQLRKRTLKLLTALAQHYPTAVISGRPRADVLARLNGARVQAVIGNHGLEPSPDAPNYHAIVKRWLPALRAALEGLQGVEIENKLYSLSIHYRRSRAKTLARATIDRAIASLGDEARAIEGKHVVNLLPAGSPNKGSALSHLRRTMQAQHALFVGDDNTDEDVFTSDNGQHLLGIRVGRATGSGATHYVSKQADIDRLLECLLKLSAEAANNNGRKPGA